jgi:hypothetical protein
MERRNKIFIFEENDTQQKITPHTHLTLASEWGNGRYMRAVSVEDGLTVAIQQKYENID